MDFSNFICPETGRHLEHINETLTTGITNYSIVGSIPRFVKSNNYAVAFGLQWNTFKQTQFDSYTKTSISEKRLENTIGYSLAKLEGKRVLEAGSGAGRFTEILLKYGAKVYSFDYSNSVDANAENNLPNPNLTLFQADIEHIPFSDCFFDIVICIGVLQHTPSTWSSLKELSRVLRDEGEIFCDHYKYQPGMLTTLYLPWWLVVRQFSPKYQLLITDWLTDLFFPIHWVFRKNRLAQFLLRRVSPINFYYGRFDLTKELHYEWSRLDTHDRNTDYYKRHVTKRGFGKIFTKLGFKNVVIEIGGTGYIARAIKLRKD